MLRNKLDLLNGEFNGLNMNPISLEFSQQMTTSKFLLSLLAKIDSVIKFTNEWYEEIIKDLENDGVLYNKLFEEINETFGGSIEELQNNITTLNELLTALSYSAPSINLSSSSSNYLYAVGESVNSVMLNFSVVKGSNNLVKAEIYKNGSLIHTMTNIQNGNNSFVDGSIISNDTSYYVKVFDDKGNVKSNTLSFKFVYNAFYGKINVNDTINDALIMSLNNTKFDNTFNFNVTLNDELIIIVSNYLLRSVLDSENYDMIDSFDISNTTINVNNIPTQYYVYVSKNAILDSNFNIIIEK